MKPSLLSLSLLSILALTGCETSSQANTIPSATYEPIENFVTQEGANLVLNGKEFKIAGTNNYYMHYGDHSMINSVLDDCVEMGINTIRVWGFLDGVDHNHTMQPKPNVYDIPAGVASGYSKLDYTVAQAKKRGIRVVIALTNNWGDFGGMPQYVKWFDAKDHDDFYTNPKIKETYKAYVNNLLSHKNEFTGIENNQEPTIMTWELANEPRAQSDKSGNTLYNWAKEMSDYVRSLAPNQLIAIGTEGFMIKPGSEDWCYNGNDGIDWRRNLTLPNVNYGTFHLYPEHWLKPNVEQWGSKWIKDHADIAKALNKPVVLEEYGVTATSGLNRDFIYKKWNEEVIKNNVNGSMFWILTSSDPSQQDHKYPDYDGFRVLNDNGSTDRLLTNINLRLRGESYTDASEVYFTLPVNNTKISEKDFKLSVYPFASSNDQVNSVKVSFPSLSKSFELSDPDGDGYYEAKLNPNEIGFGKHIAVAVVNFEKQGDISSKINFELEQKIKDWAVGTQYDFSNGDLSNWESEGIWQASWGSPAISVSDDLGKNMLKLNVEMSGNNDWEEVKIRNSAVKSLAKHKKMSFNLYVPVNDKDAGGLRPYAALGDGWVKLSPDENRVALKDLKKVTLNGHTVYEQKIEITIGEAALGKLPDFFIGIVGDKMAYTGPVYVSDINFYEPIFE